MRILHRNCVAAGLIFCAMSAWPIAALADGGAVCLSEQSGNYQIALFTAPTPLRAGPVDVSVLIQNATTHEPVADAEITITATDRDAPNVAISQPAAATTATNKLFQAAQFNLPTSGRWELQVAVTGSLGSAQVHTEVEVAEPLPRWLSLWPWLAWPAVAIVLFGAREFLVRRKSL
jgi:hypothetical protein